MSTQILIVGILCYINPKIEISVVQIPFYFRAIEHIRHHTAYFTLKATYSTSYTPTHNNNSHQQPQHKCHSHILVVAEIMAWPTMVKLSFGQSQDQKRMVHSTHSLNPFQEYKDLNKVKDLILLTTINTIPENLPKFDGRHRYDLIQGKKENKRKNTTFYRFGLG